MTNDVRVSISGYAATFGTLTLRDIIARPMCFDILSAARGGVPLLLCHDPYNRTGATTSDKSLKVWQDGYGLAFTASLEVDRYSLGLLRSISNRSFNAVSVTYAPGRRSRTEIIDGRKVEIIHRTRVEEISIVPEGADPHAWAWVDDVDSADLPWQLAQVVDGLRAQRLTASARPRAVSQRGGFSSVFARGQSEGLQRIDWAEIDRQIALRGDHMR